MGFGNYHGKRQCTVIRADAYTASMAFRRAASLERDRPRFHPRLRDAIGRLFARFGGLEKGLTMPA